MDQCLCNALVTGVWYFMPIFLASVLFGLFKGIGGLSQRRKFVIIFSLTCLSLVTLTWLKVGGIIDQAGEKVNQVCNTNCMYSPDLFSVLLSVVILSYLVYESVKRSVRWLVELGGQNGA